MPSFKYRESAIGFICAGFMAISPMLTAADEAERIFRESNVRGGLVVHLGCGDGRLTAALCANDSYVVHGLDTDPERVAKARQAVQALGLYGKVSVRSFAGRHLPYVDNLVNLLVAEDLGDVPMSEVLRVLAPRGVAIVGGRRAVKPWPDGIDEWSHYLHGPDNNAVAEDVVVGPPRRMHWLAGPAWTRHHHADKGTYPTIRAVVSSRGRLYYMVDETNSSDMEVPSTWFLAARDAFSGVLLWKRPLEAPTFERRLEQVWRTLVADGERVYAPLGVDLPLSALDSATGAVVREYVGTDGLQEVILDRGVLFVVGRQNAIRALRAETGQPLWQWEPGEGDAVVPLTLAASEGRVFVKTERGICCLAADEGKVQWHVDLEGPEKNVALKWPREKLLVSDGVVLCSFAGKDPKDLDRDTFEYLGSHPRVHDYGGKLAALAAEDGSMLWQADYLPGLESTPGEIYVSAGIVWLGPDFAEPRDLRTGAVIRTRPVLDRLWTTGHHYRCYPGKATSRYILTAKRGIELIDLAGEDHSRNNWVRATCRVGVTPCNGLLYAPPHSCGCYMEAKLYGFWALAAGGSTHQGQELSVQQRLKRGPAYGQSGETQAAGSKPSGWWTYRGDPARSGSTAAPVPSELRELWKTDIGGRLSAATVAGGMLFVAEVDAHTVHALEAETGQARWCFTAGGRVDSPPTLYRGLVLFGSSDGCVYCLRASDGELLWRFQAAPREVGAVAFEQVESLWPVHGSVLVDKGTVYLAAGRSSYLDDGISVYGLDPVTGEVRSTTRLVSQHAGALDAPSELDQAAMRTQIRQNNTDYKTFLAPDQSDAFSMRGALTDVMVSDGESIFMRQLRFDGRLVQQEEKRPHLFSTSRLLDDTEHNRSYWVLGTGDFSRTPVAYPWIVKSSLAVPYGVMLAFDERTVWGVHREEKKGQRLSYTVFASARPDASDAETLLPDFAARSGQKNPAADLWKVDLPLRPRAMLRGGEHLFVAGTSGPADPERAPSPGIAALEGEEHGLLQIVACSDGATLGRMRLASPPVWDGMASSREKLYLPLTDGSVVCLGATRGDATK